MFNALIMGQRNPLFSKVKVSKISALSSKRLLFLLLLIATSVNFSAQQRMKDFSKIMRSTSIYEIDAYLRIAHPDDPKRLILKPRLVAMLKEYIENASPIDSRVPEFQKKIALLRRKPSTRISFDEINENIRQKQIEKYKKELEQNTVPAGQLATTATIQNPDVLNASTLMDQNEQEEFEMLMAVSPQEHKNKTVKILNSLFDNDPTSKESIVMIENKSDCNMIVRIEGVGTTKYRLAVPSRKDGSIVISKGDYLFSSNVCGAQYASQKTVQKAIMVSLGSSSK